MRILAWLFACVPALWAVFRLGGLDRGYPLVPLAAFTPYVALAGAAIVLALVALRQWKPVTLAMVSTLALGVVLLPRAVGAEGAVGERFRVLSANVAVGSVPSANLVALVSDRKVDLLSVQELTPELADELDRAGLPDLLPHAVTAPVGGASGTGLYSRRPLRQVDPPVGGPFSQVAARTEWGPVGRFTAVAVHLPAPTSTQHVQEWQTAFRGLPTGGAPRLLAGDFNATLDHSALRRLLDAGYTDAAASTGDGLGATWPAGRLFPPGIVIDHVLTTPEFRPVRTETLALTNSDHRAVYAEFVCRDVSRCPLDD